MLTIWRSGLFFASAKESFLQWQCFGHKIIFCKCWVKWGLLAASSLCWVITKSKVVSQVWPDCSTSYLVKHCAHTLASQDGWVASKFVSHFWLHLSSLYLWHIVIQTGQSDEVNPTWKEKMNLVMQSSWNPKFWVQNTKSIYHLQQKFSLFSCTTTIGN